MPQGCCSAYKQRRRGGRRPLQWALEPGLHARPQRFRRCGQCDAIGTHLADAQLTSGAPCRNAGGPCRVNVLHTQVVGDWNELQHLTAALKQWRMPPDFSCLDEGTRIGISVDPICWCYHRIAAARVLSIAVWVICRGRSECWRALCCRNVYECGQADDQQDGAQQRGDAAALCCCQRALVARPAAGAAHASWAVMSGHHERIMVCIRLPIAPDTFPAPTRRASVVPPCSPPSCIWSVCCGRLAAWATAKQRGRMPSPCCAVPFASARR